MTKLNKHTLSVMMDAIEYIQDESLGVDMDVNDTFDNEEVFESLMSAVIQYGVINGFVNEDDM